VIFPLILVIGLAVATVGLRSKIGTAAIETRTSGEGATPVFQTQPGERIARLMRALESGLEPSRWTIDEAIREAYETGNWGLVRKLCRTFPRPEDETPTAPADGQTDKSGEETVIVIGRNSPFDGVPNDAWNQFVSKLETQPEDFKSDRHIGRYYHSIDRISQLGFSPEDFSPDKQYEALVADLSDSKEKAKDLVHDYLCHPVSVNGTDHMITLSGLLGLLKAAGPQNARSWIENAEDRTKFPRTTEMFVQTNGVF